MHTRQLLLRPHEGSWQRPGVWNVQREHPLLARGFERDVVSNRVAGHLDLILGSVADHRVIS